MSFVVPLVFSTVFGVAGQLLLKAGMNRMGPVNIKDTHLSTILLGIAKNGYVVGGLFVFGLGVFFWLIVLSLMPLSYAYPFASLSYLLITVTSILVLREKVQPLRVMGVLLTCGGILVVALS